jgi:hypothetical protein
MAKKTKITRNKITTTWKADKAKKAKVAKAPGVIDTIVAVLKDGGGSLETIVAKVQKKFPDRKADGLAKTCRVQMNRLSKSKEEGGRSLKVKREKQEGTRGLLYSL